MVGSKSSLGGCVEVEGVRCCSKALIDGRHEHFGEWGGDGYASVVGWILFIAFTFIQRDNLSCSPRWWRGVVYCAGIEEGG